MSSIFNTSSLFDKYYYKRAGFVGGTIAFHDFCAAAATSAPRGAKILEIGAGPSNHSSDFFATLGSVTGLDVSDEVAGNRALDSWRLFDGRGMPFEDNSFDLCMSNWVLEHVARPVEHFREVNRILRPGGSYCFRTLNAHHYVGVASKYSPHWFHRGVANRVRALKAGAHEPWPTFYRCNTFEAIPRIAAEAGFHSVNVKMFEAEPSYGKANALLFYPMYLWERAVNRTEILRSFRAGIFGCLTKT